MRRANNLHQTGDTMKTLASYDRKDYDLSYPRIISHSARAICMADKKTALIYSDKYRIYLFPGGHMEEGETMIDALIRETSEETGLVIKPDTIKEFGSTIEIRKDLWEDKIYEKYDFYYTCEMEDVTVAQRLTKGEKEARYQFEWVTLEQAISANEWAIQAGVKWIEIETDLLKLLKGSAS